MAWPPLHCCTPLLAAAVPGDTQFTLSGGATVTGVGKRVGSNDMAPPGSPVVGHSPQLSPGLGDTPWPRSPPPQCPHIWGHPLPRVLQTMSPSQMYGVPLDLWSTPWV